MKNSNKVQFYTNAKLSTIAVLYYAGKRFEGVAKWNPEDIYNKAIGEELAAAKAFAARDRYRARKALEDAQFARAVLRRAVDQARTLRAQANRRVATVREKYAMAALA